MLKNFFNLDTDEKNIFLKIVIQFTTIEKNHILQLLILKLKEFSNHIKLI